VRSAILLIIFICMSPGTLLVGKEQPKAADHKKQTILTEEEKEILKDRELLENMELLQSLDKFQYLDLFTDQDRKKEGNPAAPAIKKIARKK
jgi:hypothetical protein